MAIVTRSNKDDSKWCQLCIICNEPIELDERDNKKVDRGVALSSKVCDKCRAAVLKVRKEIENKED